MYDKEPAPLDMTEEEKMGELGRIQFIHFVFTSANILMTIMFISGALFSLIFRIPSLGGIMIAATIFSLFSIFMEKRFTDEDKRQLEVNPSR